MMVTPINGGNKPNAFKDAVRDMKENAAMYVEYMQCIAKLNRAKYLALKAEGFDDKQALELCKQVF